MRILSEKKFTYLNVLKLRIKMTAFEEFGVMPEIGQHIFFVDKNDVYFVIRVRQGSGGDGLDAAH